MSMSMFYAVRGLCPAGCNETGVPAGSPAPGSQEGRSQESRVRTSQFQNSADAQTFVFFTVLACFTHLWKLLAFF